MTVFDAEAASYFLVADKPKLLDLHSLSLFQRQQMDPTQDYLLNDTSCLVDGYSPPCPNGGSDILYLLNYIVGRYVYLKDFTLTQSYFGTKLTGEVLLFKRAGKRLISPAIARDVEVFCEIKTKKNQDMSATVGAFMETGNKDTILIRLEYITSGIWRFETRYDFIEEEIGVVILLETLTSSGQTTNMRKYAFRQSDLYGYDFVPFLTKNLLNSTGVPSVQPSLPPSHNPTISPSFLPTNAPSFNPSPQPSAKPTDSPTDEPRNFNNLGRRKTRENAGVG